ncbi:hypothetical protein UFOVP1109_14 [uncultured Caudovirales phage]|uniref:Uncharacterized protein n=1 Tax=uncultured Caudovirales phage TaxID=2100421 RepID=A0A6J5QST7_9CAUD|nr:hypothetical protein UFOVP1109_14 [uncultured Caudovirales phage]CAB4216056.1 hypothetical protein UFOVP1473_53 [uncultured Caudovirales phage]CAB5229715.1 hypothetical protein UFOVP1560_5 [uncultured Caudovirales phage]
MKVKIVEANRRAINILLGEINGKSLAHTAHDKHVFELAELMEIKLEKFGIPKKDRAGAKASGMSGGNVPTAYKYSRIVNTYTISRGSSEWFLIAANKIDTWGNAKKDQLNLTPSQRDIAVNKFTAQFSVQAVVELAVTA